MATDVRVAAIEYPESDGQPVAETDAHIDLVFDTRARLKARYATRSDVYVAGNMFVYYEEGKPHKVLAPDGFVVFGVPPGDRKTFKVWEEGRFPTVVFEFTSDTTQREDFTRKFPIYQDVWKVQEYFLFDPLDDYLDPPLLGYRMVRGELRPIKLTKDGSLVSKSLGITLSRDGDRLVMRDAVSGDVLLTKAEQKAAKAEQMAASAEQRATDAESEVARLKAELDALRRKSSSK